MVAWCAERQPSGFLRLRDSRPTHRAYDHSPASWHTSKLLAKLVCWPRSFDSRLTPFDSLYYPYLLWRKASLNNPAPQYATRNPQAVGEDNQEDCPFPFPRRIKLETQIPSNLQHRISNKYVNITYIWIISSSSSSVICISITKNCSILQYISCWRRETS